MTPYFVCYALMVAALGLGLLLDKLRIAAIIAFIPMFLLIALRGMVGTDSAVYVQTFDAIRYQGIAASGFEPGFTLLIALLNGLFPDPFDILILLGCTTALLMLAAGLLLERSPLLFATLILPYFLMDMSMNGLRYGLAFAIVAIGAAALARGWLKTFIACSIIAGSIQISSLVLAASLWALMEARIRIFFAAGAGLIVASILFGDYIGDKLSANADISGLGGVSGLVPLAATVLIIMAIRVGKGNPRQMASLSSASKSVAPVIGDLSLLAVFGMQLISFFIARYYYAGLRLQALFLFLLYILVTASYRRAGLDIKLTGNKLGLVLLSVLLLSASRLKNFNDDVMFLSPYNPYYFASELSA